MEHARFGLHSQKVSRGFKLTNGKRHAVHYWVMDARWRLLSTIEAQESAEAIAEDESSFLSAKQTPKGIP